MTINPDSPSGIEPESINIDGEAFVTPEAFARFINRSIRTLARWHAAGVGPRRVKRGNVILYRLGAIREWLTSGEAGGQRGCP